MTRRLVQSLALLIALLTVVGAASASGESLKLIGFGDSLSDPGNYYIAFHDVSTRPFEPVPDAPYLIGGFHFSNGPTWLEQLAGNLHLWKSGAPALLWSGHFTNYAVGRARARAGSPVFGEFHLAVQVERFLGDFGPSVPSGALYVIWIGSNDLSDALGALAVDPTGATSAGIVEAAVTAIAQNIGILYGHGARTFLILNVPNLALTPFVRSLPPEVQGAAELFTGGFNAGLLDVLTNPMGPLAGLPGIKFIQLDTDAILTEVADSPEQFGLTNATDSCLRFAVVVDVVCSKPAQYLFWDGIHPTKAGHAILAKEAEQLLK